ncbi:hypothetical protein [Streptomyces huiliensis]|uniref:hypothetical protein n=1 Tax=Streptomyces huiliensis TaxID=2876027 RepID=UPI001CBC5B2D|nr:hypothetical protein [Streptomyces huiliensis]MBZ4318104.1 hypothetical protein [Streptomyces huiliensis]
MGLLDRLNGTRYPAPGTTPRPAADVRAALLAVATAGTPYVVRDGTPEGVHLVAEWRAREPVVGAGGNGHIDRRFQVRMKLVPADREVRALDLLWEVTRPGGRLGRLTTETSHSWGNVNTLSRQWTFGRGPTGRLEATETFDFDTSVLKNPLRDVVLAAGWTWRGTLRRKLR